MKRPFPLSALLLAAAAATAQPCDPAAAPTGLAATYTPGVGVLLEWDAVPGSAGVALRANAPGGAGLSRRLIGAALDQYAVPDALLAPGHYRWRVQAACSPVPPFAVTPPSAEAGFTVSSADCPPTVTDGEGNVYATVPIGGRCWMAENLAVTRYRNGDSIPEVADDGTWMATFSGARAAYGNDPANAAVYGQLYNWYAVDDPRGLCPAGWRVPRNAEWNGLGDVLGGAAGRQMKAAPGDDPAWDGNNASGFGGLPGGERLSSGLDLGLGTEARWWSSSEGDVGSLAWYRGLSAGSDALERDRNMKRRGHSVRCLKE